MWGGDVSYPGVFQAELLVQQAQEVLDGEIADGFQGHGDDGWVESVGDRDRRALEPKTSPFSELEAKSSLLERWRATILSPAGGTEVRFNRSSDGLPTRRGPELKL